jgi:DNA invertase Pin-like site-specific DNA recombinase
MIPSKLSTPVAVAASKKRRGPAPFDRHKQAADLRAQALEWNEVARQLGVSVMTLYRHARRIRSLIDPKSKFSKTRAMASSHGRRLLADSTDLKAVKSEVAA